MPTTQQVCEQHCNAAIWQTCACTSCQPRLYEKTTHPADLRSFNLLRGLTWKGHDAWQIASLAVSSFTEPSQHQKNNHHWIAFRSKHQLAGPRRAAADHLDEEALGEGIEILSDIYFLGQLPSSKFYVQWAVLRKNQLGLLQPGSSSRDRMILWLNCDHVPLRNCPKRIICVVLHEMAHAFFAYYACYPWMKKRCAESSCRKLYHLNIGATGHGRAWQYLIDHIQRSMRDILGFEGDVGRKAGMCEELEAGGIKFASLFDEFRLTLPIACTPCLQDVKLLYPWSPSRWWDHTIRTKDDNAVLHLRLSRKVSRNRAWDSNLPTHRRRNSD